MMPIKFGCSDQPQQGEPRLMYTLRSGGKMTDTNNVADSIRELRIANGLSQQELASRLGVSQPTLSTWETGKKHPNAEQQAKLERLLGSLAEAPQRDEEAQAPISAWLQRAMALENLTPVELSEEAGVSIATIYNLLTGRATRPHARTLANLERVLKRKFEGDGGGANDVQPGGIGELIDFNPYEESEIPKDPGIYVFYDVSSRPVYVGKAQSISDRLRSHHDKFWFKPPIVEYAAYIKVADAKLRDQIETVLIQFLKSNAVINRNKTARE